MPLVAYDCSDESDKDSDSFETETVTEVITSNCLKEDPVQKTNSSLNNDSPINSHTEVESLFNKQDDPINCDLDLSFLKLPQAKYHSVNYNQSKIQNSKLKTIKYLPVQSQPKLPTESCTQKTKSQVGSGLLALLPNPANEFTVVPTQIKKKVVKPSLATIPAVKIENILLKSARGKSVENDELDESFDDDDDFFSLSKVDNEPVCFEPIDVDMPQERISSLYDIKMKETIVKYDNVNSLTTIDQNQLDDQVKNQTNYEHNTAVNSRDILDLDDDAIKQLCGRKRKGQIPDDLEFIEIHQDNILAESKKMLAKQLSEEVSYRPARRNYDGPSSLQKRKHQITYLAFQAKERELELKNQWANSRLTKQQTQSKYGF